MAKLGFSTPPTDFESRLYLCHGAFSYLDTDFFYRASWRLVFPLHAALVCTVLFYLFRDTILQWCGLSLATSPKRSANVSEKNVAATLEVPAATYRSAADGPPPAEPNLDYLCCRRPNLTLLVICSTLYGFLAMMALRFKYLWYPCMCVLASVCVADQRMWSWLIAKLPSRKHTDADSQSDSDTDSGIEGTRSKSSQTSTRGVLASVCVTLMAFGIASAQFYPTYVEWMRDLKEFWDPDTVELMQWIRAQTAPDASLAGSMQLMASVKACTSRHIANHPHFEDKWLRERTARLYQIYARAPPQKVHQILAQEKVDYIILEDSICLSRSSGCSTPDLVDLHNGHVPEYALLPAHQDVFRAFSEWIRTRLVPIYSLNSQNTSTNVHRVHLFLDFLGLSIWDEDAATALAATLLDTDLRREHTPRFCDQIRHLDDLPEFGEYFELLFENHTFRLYKVR